MVVTVKKPFAMLRGMLLCLPLVVGMLSAPANAQSVRDVDQRLQRVERVLDQSLLELLQQIESLKREIRQLRGELENQSYTLETLKKRNRDLYLDTDQRLLELEKNQEPGTGFGLEGDLFPEDAADPVLDGTTGSLDADDQGLQPPVNAAVTEVASNDDASVAVATRPATADEKKSFTAAYDLLASGQTAAAIVGFDEFVSTYPDGPFTDNAWYWRGEASYSEGDYSQAIDDFLVVISDFPASQKVPDARVKTGYAQFQLQQYSQARSTLNTVVEDYPGRTAAILARKQLQKMDNLGL